MRRSLRRTPSMIGRRQASSAPPAALAALCLLLVLLAFARPLDHDESQYVAAAALARHGLVYRDFAYLQTPLQPLLFAPIVAVAGALAFPALRIANALLGAVTVALVYGAARAAGADRRAALIAAAAMVCCDIFLFSAAVARNDMLPAALLAGALVLIVRQAHDRGGRRIAMAIGFLLSAATAAKLSYAVPALAYGGLALLDRRYRPGWVMLGAVLPALFVAATWAMAPAAFAFDVLRFPVAAPAQFYIGDRAWKMALGTRMIDVVKFIALGPALPALVLIVRHRRADRVMIVLEVMIVAGLVAAVLPAPTWRQYLLVALPPLFVRLALVPAVARPPRWLRAVGGIFAIAGVAPSIVTLAATSTAGLPLVDAIVDGQALRRTFDAEQVEGPVATLSPQFLAATARPPDRRFAAGPFYFRSQGLLTATTERQFHLLGHTQALHDFAINPPAAIVTGGEAAWTSGDPHLDAALAADARALDYVAHPVAGTPFTLFVRPR
jgi:4-amino-4-deoxy-L-arabinose transferase-like glycosyltransferase